MKGMSRRPVGTLVKFHRKGRKNGHRAEWIDEGRIEKVNVYTYLIRNEAGEMFVRSFDELVEEE